MWPPALSPNWTFSVVLYSNRTHTLKNKCRFQWEVFTSLYCFHSFSATIILTLMIKAIVLLRYRAFFFFFSFSGLGWSRMCSNSCSQLGFHCISDWPDYFPNDRIQNSNHIRTHWSWFCFWCSWSFSGGSAGYMSSWASLLFFFFLSFFFFSHGGLTFRTLLTGFGLLPPQPELVREVLEGGQQGRKEFNRDVIFQGLILDISMYGLRGLCRGKGFFCRNTDLSWQFMLLHWPPSLFPPPSPLEGRAHIRGVKNFIFHHLCYQGREWDNLRLIYCREECLWWYWEGSSESCGASLEVPNLNIIDSGGLSSLFFFLPQLLTVTPWQSKGEEQRVMGSSLVLWLGPLLILSLPARHKVIRAVCDVGLELVQLTPRTSSYPCTHFFEQLISTFVWLR